MRVRFWGVRGSIPAPGVKTSRYGGNTSCVELTLKDGTTVLLDAGTGLRVAGLDFVRRPRKFPIHMLVTHHHWDHIQGFPFFVPIYDGKTRLVLHPCRTSSKDMLVSMFDQMDGAHFPVQGSDIPAKVEFNASSERVWKIGDAEVTRIRTNHPGGGWGFCVQEEGRKFVYLTDNELDPPQLTTTVDEFAEFCKDADLMVLDAQYTPKELAVKKGWGHSSILQAVDLGARAQARCVALYHHDPERTDDELDQIGAESDAWLKRRNPESSVLVTREGLEFEVGQLPSREAVSR